MSIMQPHLVVPPADKKTGITPFAFGGLVGGVIAACVLLLLGVIGYSAFTYFYGGDPLKRTVSSPRTNESESTPSPRLSQPAVSTPTATPVPNSTPEPLVFQRARLKDETIDASDTTFRVFMPRGSIAVAINGPQYRKKEFNETYLFKARGGQTLGVKLIPGSSNPSFQVRERVTGNELSGLVQGEWATNLPADGDYEIRICCAGAYRLEVIIR